MGGGPLQITRSASAASGGSGTVTSIASGGGIVVSPSPITSTGTVYESHTINAQTGTTYTILTGDHGKLITFSNGSAIAVTLPQSTGSAYPTGNFGAGFCFYCQNLGAGTVTITPTTSTIDGAASLTIPTGQGCLIVADGTNYNTMRGRPTGVTVGEGGTGLTSGTSGGIPYFSAASTMASSAALTASALVVGGGAGATPKTLSAATNGQIPIGSTGADPVIAAPSGTAPISVTTGAGSLTVTTSMATNKLIGRGTAGTGVMEEITLGTNLSLSGTTLNASGGGTSLILSRVTTQADRTTTTLSTTNMPSWTLTGSTTYSFFITFICTTGAGGLKFDLAGGTCTATTINAASVFSQDGGAGGTTFTTKSTALSTSLFSTLNISSVTISGTITVNSGGTFIPQFAQNSASGTSSVLVGSWGYFVANP